MTNETAKNLIFRKDKIEKEIKELSLVLESVRC